MGALASEPDSIPPAFGGQIPTWLAPASLDHSAGLGLGVAVSMALAFVVAPGPSPALPHSRAGRQQRAFPCDVQTTERIVAVGDVHGAFDKFVAILRAAGLIDTRNRWIGKKAVLVQTGDVLDRGPDSRKALDLLRKLEGEAQRAGGRVYALLGNHELMRLVSDWRYVSQGETEAFKNADSIDLRERAFTVFSTEAEKAAKAVGKAVRSRGVSRAVHEGGAARQSRDAVRVRRQGRVRGVGASARGGRAHQWHPVPARRDQRRRGRAGMRRDQRRRAQGSPLAASAARAGPDALLCERNRSALVSEASPTSPKRRSRRRST